MKYQKWVKNCICHILISFVLSVCIKNVVCHILGSKSTSTINHSEAAARRVLRPATLLKKRLRTGVFLRILQND